MPKLLDKMQKWVGEQRIIIQLVLLFSATFLILALLIAAFN